MMTGSERHAGAAAHGPDGEILAAQPADLAADQEPGAAQDIVTDADGGPRRPALDERGRQQQDGVLAGEVIVRVESHIWCDRSGAPVYRIGHLDAGTGSASGERVLGL